MGRGRAVDGGKGVRPRNRPPVESYPVHAARPAGRSPATNRPTTADTRGRPGSPEPCRARRTGRREVHGTLDARVPLRSADVGGAPAGRQRLVDMGANAPGTPERHGGDAHASPARTQGRPQRRPQAPPLPGDAVPAFRPPGSGGGCRVVRRGRPAGGTAGAMAGTARHERGDVPAGRLDRPLLPATVVQRAADGGRQPILRCAFRPHDAAPRNGTSSERQAPGYVSAFARVVLGMGVLQERTADVALQ